MISPLGSGLGHFLDRVSAIGLGGGRVLVAEHIACVDKGGKWSVLSGFYFAASLAKFRWDIGHPE